MRSGWGAIALLIGMTFAAEPASALPIVRTSADSGGTGPGSDVESRDHPNLAGEPHISAFSHASDLDAHSHITAGSISSCFSPSPPSNCATVGSNRVVNSFASANGNDGTLRTGVHANVVGPIGSGTARGTAAATLIDTIELTSPVIKISIDVNTFTTQGSSGDAGFQFLFGFADPTPENLEDAGPTSIFRLEAFRDDTGGGIDEGYAIYLLDSETPVQSGSSVPGSFDFEIDLTDEAFAALFTSPLPPFPPPFSLDDPNLFEFTLIAHASCSHDPCSATSRLDGTLYIGLEGISANNYNYLGRDAVAPPPTGIPTPASAALLLGGLLGLAAFRRR